MGNRSQRNTFDTWDLQRLQQATGLPQQQLVQLYQRFQEEAGRDGQISKSEFRDFYEELGQGNASHRAIDQVFRAFDRDNSGRLNFEEFVSAVIMLNQQSNPYDRVSFLIDQHNPNASQGYITPEYGQHVFSRMNDFYGTNVDPYDAWSQLDNGQGYVSSNQFAEYLSNHPQYSQFQY
ncbi:unnamed protein product [Didymodactylos carnosus]|uniref:EF-hand domain-containing protein n=1 Tax=Didymodactylos carnosus TaxID=1234261 RepID=A0A815XM77_9BILA|nr:unnamed protein product [Didymodactylos carnosus]CAF4420628.1 unnamed protein product [Didymodactylos carnosus]